MSFLNFLGSSINGGVNYKIAQENLDFQKENLAYQKALQQTIFQREDNAVQRRAADLEKAGLSKTLAAGSSAGAGQAISTQAPRNDYQSALQLPDVINIVSQIEALKQQKYALEYAQDHGLPLGSSPNMFTEVADAMYKIADKFGGKDKAVQKVSDSIKNITDSTKNAWNDLGFEYLFQADLSPFEKIKAVSNASVGNDPSKKDSYFTRNVKRDKNGKAINPYRNPKAFKRVSFYNDSSAPGGGGGRSW